MIGSRARLILPFFLALLLGAGTAFAATGCGGGGGSTITAAAPATTQAAPTQAAAPSPTTPTVAPPAKPKPKQPTTTTTATQADTPAGSGAASVSGSGPQSDRAAILAALPTLPYPKSSYRLDVRVSKKTPTWAAVYIRPAPGFENQIQSDAASFTKSGGGWKLHEVGNGGGCGVPAAVRSELKLACY